MAKIPKRVICFATIAVILCGHIQEVHAEALPEVLQGSATLADNIMSYYAMSGSAVANVDWINNLYDAFGSTFGTVYDFAENGMLTVNSDGTWQATTALETAIENAPAYQSLGLDQIFNVSAQEAAAGGGIAASGAATLAGSIGGVASTGVLPLLGGVTAAYWGGIAIGTLANHLIERYGKAIYCGVPINSEKVLNSLPSNTNPVYSRIKSSTYGNYKYLWYVEGGSMYWADLQYSGSYALIYNNVSSGMALKYYRESPSGVITFGTSNNNIQASNGLGFSSFSYDQRPDASPVSYSFSTLQEWQDFLASVRNGTTKLTKLSNDMIGENGNLQGEYDNGYLVPDLKPQIDPGVQAGVPLTLNDWLNFANSVSNNNSQTNPESSTEANKNLFDNLIPRIVTPRNPDPDPDPDPTPDPYHPPTPTPVPDPDYGDPNPDQPEFESETNVPDPVDTGKPWVTPDLLEKFPFCIPKDMIDMVKGFKSADRTAPHISWNFKSPVGHVDYTFNLDLKDFEDVATLLRALELAAFIVGLAFATRYLIGAS